MTENGGHRPELRLVSIAGSGTKLTRDKYGYRYSCIRVGLDALWYGDTKRLGFLSDDPTINE